MWTSLKRAPSFWTPIVESDDALMEKYLMEGNVSAEELNNAIPKALAAGTVIPIFCVSAKKDVGVAELLDAIGQDALSPTEARPRVASKGQADGGGRGRN